ncbi:hypothetical protein HCN44_002611 [Aphidius gifuensis]|uniref:Mitochondrial transcription rescue factor 1 C-terminal domain-containing protein n=1 Tax=Aphidius gifuensis TaxID=684658 RepID=A0A835CNP8_APHGI|nr:hypothetical protein HCN44_002611 [Aphidius gifuensis]
MIINYARNIHSMKLDLFNKSSCHVNVAKIPLYLSNNLLDVKHNLNKTTQIRLASNKKSKKNYDSDDGDDDDDEDKVDPEIREMIANNRNAKIITPIVNSMRIDAIVKGGFGVSRAKAETILYDSKLRINGYKVPKKGLQIGIDDVIDLIQGPSPKNPDFLVVTRIKILDANTHENMYKVKMLREKNLVIENYEDSWNPVADE